MTNHVQDRPQNSLSTSLAYLRCWMTIWMYLFITSSYPYTVNLAEAFCQVTYTCSASQTVSHESNDIHKCVTRPSFPVKLCKWRRGEERAQNLEEPQCFADSPPLHETWEDLAVRWDWSPVPAVLLSERVDRRVWCVTVSEALHRSCRIRTDDLELTLVSWRGSATDSKVLNLLYLVMHISSTWSYRNITC